MCSSPASSRRYSARVRGRRGAPAGASWPSSRLLLPLRDRVRNVRLTDHRVLQRGFNDAWRRTRVGAGPTEEFLGVYSGRINRESWGSPTITLPVSFAEQDMGKPTIAQSHSETIERREDPILRREVVLPVHHSAGQLARAALDEAIPPPALNGRSDDPRVAVSELVSNAVRHAGLVANSDLIHLRIEADDDHVRVEVEQRTSAGDVEVVLPRVTQDRFGGFGLQLVQASADAWGFEPGPPGCVWFEFRV